MLHISIRALPQRDCPFFIVTYFSKFVSLFLLCNYPVNSRTIESMAKTSDMSVSEFADETGRALTGQTAGQDNFVYQAKLHGSNLQVKRSLQVIFVLGFFTYLLLVYMNYKDMKSGNSQTLGYTCIVSISCVEPPIILSPYMLSI